MTESDFPDLEGKFELVDAPAGQLDDPISPAIAQEDLHRTYWKLTFRRVQYGTFRDQHACVFVVEGKFHAEGSKRHRFTWIRLKIGFKEAANPIEVLDIAPHLALGISVPEQRASSWALSSKLSIAAPGLPVTVDLFHAQLEYSKTYQVDRVAKMKGSERGFPVAREAVWTLEEASQEGLPQAIPPFVILVKCPPGESFMASFDVEAKVGFSMNPLRWPLLRGTPKPVHFNGLTEYLPVEGALNRDFSTLDLSTLTRLDFKETQG